MHGVHGEEREKEQQRVRAETQKEESADCSIGECHLMCGGVEKTYWIVNLSR